ncbi:transferase with NAD(P)-binding Rossmann-fold domain; UPF0052 family [Escherichia coli]|uniref:Transferase with NAD(P)-binding Rossmann-fold domain UPF0052 family n=1 Tax=Escherichia coli TaxID=562 RepID=A0A376VLM6_ECOLX|nr:transferase with NAD(P)-binding Rossmann-fold domain; UPF0052 family [Escherichia coli]
MRNRTLADLDRVVALGGGHGLGRVSLITFVFGFSFKRVSSPPRIMADRRGVFAAQKAVLPGAICVTASTS